jgi:hypothetical protein
MYSAIFLTDKATFDRVKTQSAVIQAHDPFNMVVIDSDDKLTVDIRRVKNTLTFSDLDFIPSDRAIISVYDQQKSSYTDVMNYLQANKIKVISNLYNMGMLTVELPRGSFENFQDKLNNSGIPVIDVEQDFVHAIDLHYAFTYGQHWHLGAINAQCAWNNMRDYASNISTCNDRPPVFMPNTGERDITMVSCCDQPEVAILDSGVQTNHPDLVGRFGTCGCDGDPIPAATNTGTRSAFGPCTNNWNCVDNNSNVNPQVAGAGNMGENHGTCVAGIIAANNLNNNYTLSVGNNYIKAQILRIGYPVGPTGVIFTSTSIQLDALYRASQNPSCVAVNMSYGGGFPSVMMSNAFAYLREQARNCKGILVFASAGNQNTTTLPFPANDASVLAIAATNSSNEKATFSNYGNGVFAAAPGQSIRTTDRTGTNGYSSTTSANPITNADAYATDLATTLFGGTSASSPIAAAIAASAFAVNPSLSASQVEIILRDAAQEVVTPGLGYGLLDMCATVNAAIDSLTDPEDIAATLSIVSSPSSVQTCFATPTTVNVSLTGSGDLFESVENFQLEFYAANTGFGGLDDVFLTSNDILLYQNYYAVTGSTTTVSGIFTIPNNPAYYSTSSLVVRATMYNSCGQVLGSGEYLSFAPMNITAGSCSNTDLKVEILSWSYATPTMRIFQVRYTNMGTTSITSASVQRGWVGGSTVTQNITWNGTTNQTSAIQPGQSRISFISFNAPSPNIPANYFHQIVTVNGTSDFNIVNNYASIAVNS